MSEEDAWPPTTFAVPERTDLSSFELEEWSAEVGDESVVGPAPRVITTERARDSRYARYMGTPAFFGWFAHVNGLDPHRSWGLTEDGAIFRARRKEKRRVDAATDEPKYKGGTFPLEGPTYRPVTHTGPK